MRRLVNHPHFFFSNYLETLYQASVKSQTPFFRVDSSQIQILDDPLDFYLHLNVQACGTAEQHWAKLATNRTVLSVPRNRHIGETSTGQYHDETQAMSLAALCNGV